MDPSTVQKNRFPSHVKCLFAALPVRTPIKMYVSLEQNGSGKKKHDHSALELSFWLQPRPKMQFRCRVVKATIVSNGKRHGFEHLSDPK